MGTVPLNVYFNIDGCNPLLFALASGACIFTDAKRDRSLVSGITETASFDYARPNPPEDLQFASEIFETRDRV